MQLNIMIQLLYRCRSHRLLYCFLAGEIKTSGIDQEDLWKLWHGDSHLIADDKLKWKEACPTFHMVLHKIQEYFEMDIKGTFQFSLTFKLGSHCATTCDNFEVLKRDNIKHV